VSYISHVDITQGIYRSFLGTLVSSHRERRDTPRRLRLLVAIGETGSISAAVKAIGMRYKATWDAVEAMNNLAGTTLLRSKHDGKDGGCAVLTEVGQR